ncbi:MAG: hypothetical protein JJ866_16630 [Roseibium sp.]|uniref:hypothetical protein n=1 Tax=Roseibium sp. TaxID=1936156 RepID=UPI001B16A291|nr:hypothetical protein [Roseibium sp.]MBO6893570.1 hypothetical protein [Roseibium sp.]
MSPSTRALILVSLLVVLPDVTFAACSVSQDKKVIITDFMCGKYSQEPYYRKEGPGCVRASMEARLFDSAVAIHNLSVCGYGQVADEYFEAAKVTNSVLQSLSTCTTEQLGEGELDLLLAAQVDEVKKQAGDTKCVGQLQKKTVANVPRIKGEIYQIQGGGLAEQLTSGLGISISTDGNISER